MTNSDIFYQNLINFLNNNKVEYKHFHHQSAHSYEQLLQAQKETGFFGTESKCMALKTDGLFIVYVTIQGKKVNFDKIKKITGAKKVRLSTPEELKEVFNAEPGCVYPFGFDEGISIYVDPIIYKQQWFLFSPVFSNQTIQAKGKDLKKVFDSLNNKVSETSDFNQ